MSTPILRISDLRVAFGTTAAVDGVDLTVRRGEVVALVGESGSGKTMIARSVLGLLPEAAAVAGSVELDGTEVVGAEESELDALRGTRAAMVFQEPQTALNPVRTIGWQLVEALRAHRSIPRSAARARAAELLELVGIPDPAARLRSYPHQLSGGQKQRVVIALALSGEPQVLLADEPTTALDVTVQAQILELLRDLRDRLGVAVLLVTHNMGVVSALADRVVVLRHGRVVEARSAPDLFARPATDYTRDLLVAVPRLPEVGEPGVADDRDPTDALLALDAVSVVYAGRRGGPTVRAVDGVTLTVRAGEVVGLVGESGSGKTTVGRAAVGLVPVTGGAVRLDGQDLAGGSRTSLRELRRGLAMIHQDPAASLDPRFTVGECIAEPLHIHGAARGEAARERVAELLDAVRLPAGHVARRPGELSGGQRQRVALARALALAPRLVIADEPTSALDVSVQADVLDLFDDLRRELGFACLFISHDLGVVDRVADRVAVLRHGTLLELGTPDEVFLTPQHEYTRALVAAVPRVPVPG